MKFISLKELIKDRDAIFTLIVLSTLITGWTLYKTTNDIVIAWYIEQPIVVIFAFIISYNLYKQLRLHSGGKHE